MKRKRYKRVTHQPLRDYHGTKIYLCELCLQTFDTGVELREHKMIHCTRPVKMLRNRKMGTSVLPELAERRLEHLESFRLLRTMLQNGLKFKLLSVLDNKTLQHSDIDNNNFTKQYSPGRENVNAIGVIGTNKKKVVSGTKEVGFTCGECGKWFFSKVTLKTHLNSHLGLKPYKCPKCGLRVSQKGGLTVHMRIHTGEKPFKCKVCHRSFTQQVSRDHMAAHMGEKPYKCDLCPSVFGSSTVLKTHKIAKHSLLRPHQCDICKKNFADVYYMRKHRTIHRKVKPYPCTKCDKSFITKSNLTRHLITHTGERPYVCTLCQKSYTNSGALIYHMTTHADERSYICGICGQKLSSKQNLESHVQRHAKSIY